jgi:hypothetical protein
MPPEQFRELVLAEQVLSNLTGAVALARTASDVQPSVRALHALARLVRALTDAQNAAHWWRTTVLEAPRTPPKVTP